MNFRKLLNKENLFIVASGGGATPLELDKVKRPNKLKGYWPKKNYKKKFHICIKYYFSYKKTLKSFILCILCPRISLDSCHTEGQKLIKIGPFPEIMSVID